MTDSVYKLNRYWVSENTGETHIAQVMVDFDLVEGIEEHNRDGQINVHPSIKMTQITTIASPIPLIVDVDFDKAVELYRKAKRQAANAVFINRQQ